MRARAIVSLLKLMLISQKAGWLPLYACAVVGVGVGVGAVARARVNVPYQSVNVH